MNLVDDPHLDLKPPSNSTITLIRGSLKYYHYVCDGFEDKGWGCGYRTLQTICSWIKKQNELNSVTNSPPSVPSIIEIQEALVHVGDKKPNFVGSREWIGSLEIAYCVDYFYQVQCRIIHARNISDLKEHANEVTNHFEKFGSPIMMGGDQDCSAKCILGISFSPNGIWLLILDPHYIGCATSKEKLQSIGWIKWQLIDSLNHSSFYNLCCPLLEARH